MKLRFFIAAIVLLFGIVVPSHVRAAGPTIYVEGPDLLFNDQRNGPITNARGPRRMLRAGTFEWEYVIDPATKQLHGRLTLQFAPPIRQAVGSPGPIVLFWTVDGCVDTDLKFEGCDPIRAPIHVAVRTPNCTRVGACAVGFDVSASVAKHYAAAVDKQPNQGTHITFRYTAVRSFASGAYQVMPPWVPVGGDFGDLPRSGYWYGNNFAYAAFERTDRPEIVPGEFNWYPRYRRALTTFDAASPAPGYYPRVAVFTGNWPRPHPRTPDPRIAPCNELTYCGPRVPSTAMAAPVRSPTPVGVVLLILAVASLSPRLSKCDKRVDCCC
jgi:hypothetical protein